MKSAIAAFAAIQFLFCAEGWCEMPFDPAAFDRKFKGRAHVLWNAEHKNWEVGLHAEDQDQLIRDIVPALAGAKRIFIGVVKDRGILTSAGLKPLQKLEDLKSISLYQRKTIDDAACEILANVESLELLNLKGTSVTSEGIAHLARLKQLTRLLVSDTNVDDKALEHLEGHKSLDWLDVSRTNVSDKGLSHLADCKLNCVWASETKISDAGLAHLTNMPLERLLLAKTAVTDEGMKSLAKIPSLIDLSLRECEITNLGVATLVGKLPNLVALDLSGTRVDERCVEDLIKFREMRNLGLMDTGISSDKWEWFRQQWPHSAIHLSPAQNPGSEK